VGGEEMAARLLADLVGDGIRVTAFAPSQGALESAYLAATEDRR
jgi:ABC-2 type transport system ATP-binding protein